MCGLSEGSAAGSLQKDQWLQLALKEVVDVSQGGHSYPMCAMVQLSLHLNLG
jgi:hypothetical protein